MPTSENNAILDKKIDRRGLLKKMAITGGVVVTSQLIPGEWIKPVIGVGTLPAHAQGSADAAAPLTAETIVGNWTHVWVDGNDTGTESAVFNADGTALFDGTDAMTWTLVGTTLTIVDDQGSPTAGPVSGNSNFFDWTLPDGEVSPFTRVS